jgi:vacuolar-type H+-ATPase subunit I/STV1
MNATSALLDRSAARRTGFRLTRRSQKVTLIAHVLTSVGWFGVAASVVFCAVAAALTNDPKTADGLIRVIGIIPWLSIPLGLMAVATGTLLSLGTKWGLVRHWWVVAKILIAIAVLVTDATLMAAVAHDAAATGNPARTFGSPIIPHVVVLSVATILSILKPRGHTPFGRTRAASTPSAHNLTTRIDASGPAPPSRDNAAWSLR